MSLVLGALKIILLLGFLVLIHEFGHFIVAKKCNVDVLEFSIGFGKKLWSRHRNNTEYAIRIVPLRGICKTTWRRRIH